MKNRSLFHWNGILILISIVLAVILVWFLFWNHREEQEEQKELQKLTQEEGTEQRSKQIEGVSFRGDSFGSEEEKADDGFGANLKKIFEQNDIELPVVDYTMNKESTLSQMRLAGITKSELDRYIDIHKANADSELDRYIDAYKIDADSELSRYIDAYKADAGSEQLPSAEVKMKDFSQKERKRKDQNYIPVICMGFYGGWGNDYDELCEQQQKILDTYQQNSKYLIIGVYPDGCSDKEGYRDKMKQNWGEHFVMLNSTVARSLSTEEGKKKAVQIIFDKMVELQYLDNIQVKK